jgi:hypothetical protein
MAVDGTSFGEEPGDLHGELEAELRNSSLAMESVESVEAPWVPKPKEGRWLNLSM